MRLATRRNGRRDGELWVVSPDGSSGLPGGDLAPTMQAALDDWKQIEPYLRGLSERLEDSPSQGIALAPEDLLAPLPRAYEWVDGSAYINHIVLVRKARGAEPPETLRSDPLVYQGGSGIMLGPRQDIPLPDPGWGLDFESELVVILDDTPRGCSPTTGLAHVKLITLCNDITFRNLIPPELAKGFGFFQSKPATAFAPFAITPDELGESWHEGRVHLPLHSSLNGEQTGSPEAGPEMHFGFGELIAHITRTRGFTAGTLLGSGTVSNEDRSRGVSCLAECRMREIIEQGAPSTEFMKVGDRIQIEMRDSEGRDLFGQIDQRVVTP